MRQQRRNLAWVAPVIATFALGGCGGAGGGIPQDQADGLLKEVDRIERAESQGDCERAHDRVVSARRQAKNLRSSVDAELRNRIDEWLVHIDEQISLECVPTAEETPTPSPDPEPTAEPTQEPTPEETTPTPAPTDTPARETDPGKPTPPEDTPVQPDQRDGVDDVEESGD